MQRFGVCLFFFLKIYFGHTDKLSRVIAGKRVSQDDCCRKSQNEHSSEKQKQTKTCHITKLNTKLNFLQGPSQFTDILYSEERNYQLSF